MKVHTSDLCNFWSRTVRRSGLAIEQHLYQGKAYYLTYSLSLLHSPSPPKIDVSLWQAWSAQHTKAGPGQPIWCKHIYVVQHKEFACLSSHMENWILPFRCLWSVFSLLVELISIDHLQRFENCSSKIWIGFIAVGLLLLLGLLKMLDSPLSLPLLLFCPCFFLLMIRWYKRMHVCKWFACKGHQSFWQFISTMTMEIRGEKNTNRQDYINLSTAVLNSKATSQSHCCLPMFVPLDFNNMKQSKNFLVNEKQVVPSTVLTFLGTCHVSSGRSLALQTGQVKCEVSHISMHPWWNACSHSGSSRTELQSSNSPRQTEHSDSALPIFRALRAAYDKTGNVSTTVRWSPALCI